MNKKSLQKLFEKINRQKWGYNVFWPCCTADIVIFFGFLVTLLIFFIGHPLCAFSYIFIVCCVEIAITLLAFILVFWRIRRTKIITARELDRIHDSKNRLEATLELQHSENPLTEAQSQQSIDFFAGRKLRRWFPRIIALIILALFILSVQCLLFHNRREAARKMQRQLPHPEKNDGQNKNEENKQENSDSKKETEDNKDHAELALVAPESEMRAKPMDEIAWQGNGFSSNGFDSLSLEIFVNGQLGANIPVDNFPSDKNKNIEFAGEFYLDELNVVPFDVVSYNLSGLTSVNNVKNKQIISLPQFIEVRPFREDAIIGKCKGAGQINFLAKVLRFQITLNKAVFTARSSGLTMDNPALKEQIQLLAKEQAELHDELKRFIEETPAEDVTLNMLDCLRQAADAMDAAKKFLQNSVGNIQ